MLVVLGLSQGPVKRLHVRRSVGRHLVRDRARGAVVNGHFADLGRRRLRGLRVAKAGEEEEEKKSGRPTTSPGSRHFVTNAFRAPVGGGAANGTDATPRSPLHLSTAIASATRCKLTPAAHIGQQVLLCLREKVQFLRPRNWRET